MERKILKTAILILSVILVLLCGATFALMYRQTQALNNQLEAAVVKCAVEENFDGEKKTSIAVKNTGNIDAYLRVCLVSYWVDEAGNVISKPSQMPTLSKADGWVAGTGNTYYYSKPIAPGNSTPNLLTTPLVLREEAGCLQVVEVFADAIQSKPVEAVTGSWGVTIDGDSITAAPSP